MLNVNTLMIVFLGMLIVVELVSLYTNGIITARNYKIKDDEIDALKSKCDRLDSQNFKLNLKVSELLRLNTGEGKIQAYLIDSRGLRLVTPEAYKLLTTPKEDEVIESI